MHIDWWTFALQGINVLILLWVLKRFLFAPVAAILAKRQAEATRLLESVQDADRQAKAARDAVIEQQAKLAAEIELQRAAARTDAENMRDRIVSEAHESARQIREAAQRDMEREIAIAERDILARAGGLVTGIAGKLLARLPAEDLAASFSSALVAQVAALPPEQRQALVADNAAGGRIEILTAQPLDDKAAAILAARLAELLQTGLKPVYRVDPTILGGIELHAPHVVLRNSWRDDLSQIQAELARA